MWNYDRPTPVDEKLISKRGRDFCVRHWKIESDKIPYKGQHISSNSINNKMEAISKETMWYILNEQRRTFLENFETELSDWIQECLEEQHWAILEDIADQENENWEEVITILGRSSAEEIEESTTRMYHNLQIQYRKDKIWMCEMFITKIREAIWHRDEEEECSSE